MVPGGCGVWLGWGVVVVVVVVVWGDVVLGGMPALKPEVKTVDGSSSPVGKERQSLQHYNRVDLQEGGGGYYTATTPLQTATPHSAQHCTALHQTG